MLNLNGRVFQAVANSQSGEVSAATIFRYWQQGFVVTGRYEGGQILHGQLLAVWRDDGTLDMRYQHINAGHELMTGRCLSTPEVLADGRIRLHESWQWTCGACASGTSIVEQLPVSGNSGEMNF